MILEEWRTVAEHGGYEVSNKGRVRSVDRVIRVRNRWGNMSDRKLKGRVLKPGRTPFGYPHVAVEGKATMMVHKMVAAAFMGEAPDGEFVLHKDGDPSNNLLSNLKHGTQVESMADARRHGTLVVGVDHFSAKLNGDSVRAIRARSTLGETQRSLAEVFGVSQSTISEAVNRKTWKHI